MSKDKGINNDTPWTCPECNEKSVYGMANNHRNRHYAGTPDRHQHAEACRRGSIIEQAITDLAACIVASNQGAE